MFDLLCWTRIERIAKPRRGWTFVLDTAKGNRPSFSTAARPEVAEPVYGSFCQALRDLGIDVETAVLFLSWLGALGHALAIRSEANFRIAARSSAAFSYARGREVRREQARSIAEHDPRRARELGIGRPDRDGFSGDLVDLNSAPMNEIVRLPGMTSDLARRIVDVRDEIGGFSSLYDVGQVLALDATTIDRLRPEVVVLPWD